jgi:hypothetical protein
VSGRLRIVVLGYVVRGPLGGMTWHYLHYLLGLTSLGHDVYFAEDSDDVPSCYHPVRDVSDSDPADGLAFAGETFRRFGLAGRWAYYDAPAGEWKGGAADRIIDICRTADLLLNVSGVNRMRDWFRSIPRRVLVDTDPAFTQIRNRFSPESRAYAREHTRLFSFGANIGKPGCRVPDDGFSWEPTRQPLALDHWTADRWQPFRGAPWRRRRFTSVMLWNSYPPLEYDGVHYGTKWHSFQPYASLPGVVRARLELAAGNPRWAWSPPEVPEGDLRRDGWQLRDPREVTRDCLTYRRYIFGSDAEFSLAKEGYVVSRSGWFSERSAAYLAAGKPVVAQDTGFSTWLPSGTGLMAFGNLDEARAGIESISARYDVHRRAARDIAAEYFDGRRVLTSLVERAMASSNPAFTTA